MKIAGDMLLNVTIFDFFVFVAYIFRAMYTYCRYCGTAISTIFIPFPDKE